MSSKKEERERKRESLYKAPASFLSINAVSSLEFLLELKALMVVMMLTIELMMMVMFFLVSGFPGVVLEGDGACSGDLPL